MNRSRYMAYQRVVMLLEAPRWSDEERVILKDAAEGMLLSRSPESEELHLLSASASLALDESVAEQRIGVARAAEIRGWLDRCGPAEGRVLTPGG
jgi:hypothetical protein